MDVLILKHRLIMAVLVLAHVASIALTFVKYAFLRFQVRLAGQMWASQVDPGNRSWFHPQTR